MESPAELGEGLGALKENYYHVDMTLDRMIFFRPFPELARVHLWSAEKFCQAHRSLDGSIASSQARRRFQCLHIFLSEQ
ncbi:hypothetical protein QUA44_28045 [Microcoleus sp. N9_A2]|uniref:hypothetical protein n=1 Tax=unclassified Microcoleus TaxID=2642155 RepID=UPI002FCFEE1B